MMDRQPIPNRFQGQAGIVTGGASGIGRAVVEELCKEGAAVLLLDLEPGGQALAGQLNAAGGDVLFFRGDVAEEATPPAALAAALGRWGRVDFLVNNAFSFIAKGLDATREPIGSAACGWARSAMPPWPRPGRRADAGGRAGGRSSTCPASRPSSPSPTAGPTTPPRARCIT